MQSIEAAGLRDERDDRSSTFSEGAVDRPGCFGTARERYAAQVAVAGQRRTHFGARPWEQMQEVGV